MRELRKSIIAPLFMKGYTYMAMRDIVREKLNLASLSLSTIKLDVDSLLAEWRETRINDIDMAVQLELQRIDELVKEAWNSWEKSKEDYKKAKAKQEGIPVNGGGSNGSVSVVKIIQEKEDMRACGDPRYIDTINKLLVERRKLLGLYAPEKQLVANDVSFASFLMSTGVKK